jgi:nucleotide-binding universal stress UspA family protein
MPGFASRRILCAVDLGPASRTVLEWAREFARAFQAEVDLVHADWSEPPRYFTAAQIKALMAEERKRRAKLRAELGALAREIFQPKFRYGVRVIAGHPLPVLLKQIAGRKPDLVILGSHGRTEFARLMLGSVAENIVQEASQPTLIVRGSAKRAAQVRKIICPVDFTKSGRDGLDLSVSVARAFQAHLDVVHAAEVPARDLDALREKLCRWVPEEARAECKISEVVRRGSAAEQIVLLARERSADLVVLTAERRPFLEWTTLGTTVERVLRHSPCSVLVVPRHAQTSGEEEP